MTTRPVAGIAVRVCLTAACLYLALFAVFYAITWFFPMPSPSDAAGPTTAIAATMLTNATAGLMLCIMVGIGAVGCCLRTLWRPAVVEGGP